MTRSSAGDHLKSISIFSELSSKERATVARLMTEVSCVEGTELTRQGRPGNEFMIIKTGTAKVCVDGVTVAHLGPGDFLGELAILSNSARTATVTATSPMSFEVLNRREFMSLLDQNLRLTKKILVGSVKRLQLNERSRTN